jgi:hypothetical protein
MISEAKQAFGRRFWPALAAWICTVAASLVVAYYVIKQPEPLRWWAYPYYCLPLVFSALPFWWERRRTAAKISAAFLVTFCFLGFSAGILYVPAAILMTIAAFPPRRV